MHVRIIRRRNGIDLLTCCTIVRETNRYAAQCLDGRPTTWTTTDEEVRAYFGFCILMGLVREPEIRDYWSNDDTFHYSPIAGRISRRRLEEISRYLHFVDNSSPTSWSSWIPPIAACETSD